MYANGNDTLSLPGLYDGLPIDGDTIYWEDTEDGKVLKAKFEESSGVDASEVLSIVDNAGYVTQAWVNNQNFVTKSFLNSELSKYVTIGKEYQEIEGVKNFLNGIQIGNIPIYKHSDYKDVIYIDGNVVVSGSVTMFAEGGDLDIPSIYEGLLIDWNTLIRNEQGVLMINPDIQLGGITEEEMQAIVNLINTKWTQDNNKIQQWDTAYSWGNHSTAGYVSKTYVDDTFVTFKNDEIITGLKTFTKGIQIGSPQIPIKISQLQDDILYIDSNVIIRGGLTMYYDNGEIDLPTIKDEIGIAGYDGATGLASFNSSQFSISSNGTVTIVGGSTGLDMAELEAYLTTNKYATQGWVGNQGFALQSALNTTNANVATKWTQDNNLILNWNTAYGWGNHAKAGYASKSYVDGTFVTIKGSEDVTGVHDFVNGLKIGNIKLSKSQEGVVYLEGNLVVKGGVTMYALDEVTVDSIIDSLPLASTSQYGIAKFNPSNFVINKDGFVTIIGGSGGLDTEGLENYLTTNKYVTQAWVEGKNYLTAHQTIYNLIFQSGAFSAVTFDPNGSSKTVNIPTTTSHISEGNNLYFTNARAVSALKSTTDGLASDIATKWTQDNEKISNWNTAYSWGDHSKNDYTTNKYVNDTFVTLKTKQTITGKKNFTTGGLFVNGKQIHYDATNKYWKLEGDLLVTGGVSMYSDDTGFIPSTIMDAVVVDGTSIRKNPTTGALEVIGGGGGSVSGDYLPLSGGTLKGALTFPASQYNQNGAFGLNLNNSDIVGANSIYFRDASNTNSEGLQFVRSDGNYDVVRAYDGVLMFATNQSLGGGGTSYNTVWHSGNLTSLKNPYALSWSGYSSGSYDGSSAKSISIPSNTNQLTNGAGFITSSASITGNAGSATKLQTARTIWGHSFDGTANIDDAFYMKNNTYIYFKNASGSNMIGMYASTSGNLIIGAGVASIGNSTYIDGNTVRLRYGKSSTLGLILNDIGNVGVGVDSPTNYKVEVGGVIRSTGGMVVSNTKPYWCKNSSGADLNMVQVDSSNNCLFGYSAKGSYNTYLYGNIIRLRYGNNAGDAIYVSSDGKVAINQNSANYNLHVNGNGYFSSTVYFGNSTSYYLGSAGNLSCNNITTSGYASVTGNINAYSKISLFGTTAETAVIAFNRDGYNYITFPNTLSIGKSTAGAERWLVIDSTTATFQCNILPNAHATYYLGEWGKAFTRVNVNAVYSGSNTSNLWLVGGKSADDYGVVIGRNTTNATSGAEICRFNANGLVWASGVYGDIRTTDTPIYLRYAGNNASSVLLNSDCFSPYSSATDLIRLGRPNARWNGVYVGAIGNTAVNTSGVIFCDTSTNGKAMIGCNTSGGLGIYAAEKIYLRPSCTSTSGAVTSSGIGLEINSSGIISSGGITMYSDARKKTILNNVELSLKDIANAPLIEHYYNSDQNKTTHVGSIAQYWYGMNDWFCKEDSDGYLTMEIQNCALASAISIARELDRYETKTDKTIRMLKKRVQELEDKLEKLEGGNYGCR